MTRIRTYGLLLLLGIFVHPMLYQNVHILWHTTHVCHCEKESAVPCRTGMDVVGQNHHCPICEYTFVTQPLPKSEQIHFNHTEISRELLSPVPVIEDFHILIHRPSRAPPAVHVI